jgi:hypothetical protein
MRIYLEHPNLGSNEFIKVQAFLKSRDDYATLFPF